MFEVNNKNLYGFYMGRIFITYQLNLLVQKSISHPGIILVFILLT